tara:strand:- start:470 stop:835 length:366 start_codon:yes stop_codon:yes gene_type:complete
MIKKKDNLLSKLKRGFLKLCPICGKSEIFVSYIKLKPKCNKCKTKFSKYSTEDGPAYFTIFVVGHIIIPAIVLLERLDSPPPLEFQLIFWSIFSILLSIWLLPKIKGAFLAFQINVNDSSS